MLMKRVWLQVAILLAIPLLASNASAWEFSMDGTYTWEYEYIGQQGRSGFFGPYDIDNGTGATTGLGVSASLNSWAGQQGGGIVSGTDATRNTQYMSTNIDLRINPALRIRGLYYIGEWAPVYGTIGRTNTSTNFGYGSLTTSEYLNYRYPGVQHSFSPGYWNTLWMTAQLPWGTLTFGKRPSIWGMGLAWNGVENRTSESLALTVPYGPFRIALGFYPARRSAGEFPRDAAAANQANPNFGDYYNDDFDRNNTRIYDMTIPNITYRSGDIDMGVQANFVRYHRGPERLMAVTDAAAPSRASEFTRDRDDFYGGAYLKYFNGRFFLNTEFHIYERLDRYSQRMGGRVPNSTLRPPDYIEAYRYAIEAGCVCGPAKVGAIWAWLSGQDRRYGTTRGINQGTIVNATDNSATVPNPLFQSATASNTGLFRPYSYLMVYNYGTGAYFNADTNGNGYLDAASFYAARLDYAVAANLNVYGSFAWADRVGNGHGWGYLSPIALDGAVDGQVYGFYRGGRWNPFSAPPAITTLRPNIPDSNLGYEIDAGFDWKLLEGLTLSSTFGYWQPGAWFKYACIDRSVPGWDVPVAGNFWGVNPNRTIDAIFGAEIKIIGEF